jgi:hypothetical protein
MPARVVTRMAVNLNGVSIAYLMGFANATLAVVAAFGVNLNDTQRAAVSGLVNTALILAIHLGHRIGEATASGAAGAESQRRMADAEPPPTGG